MLNVVTTLSAVAGSIIAYLAYRASRPRLRLLVRQAYGAVDGEREVQRVRVEVQSRANVEIQGFAVLAPSVSKSVPLRLKNSEVYGEELSYCMGEGESRRFWDLDVTRVIDRWWAHYTSHEEKMYRTFHEPGLKFRVMRYAGAGRRKVAGVVPRCQWSP